MNTQAQPKQQSQAYLSRKQVLDRYGIGNTTLYRWIDCDSLCFPKSVQMGPRCVRWKLSDLERWEKQRQAESA